MIKNRAYKSEDFQRICDFFNDIYKINKNQHSWLPARWIYAEYLVCPLFTSMGLPNWHSTIRIWETDAQQIIGVVSSETPDQNVYLQIHPDFRFIENEMIEWAQRYLAIIKSETGEKELSIWANDSDQFRMNLLKLSDYVPGDECEYLNAFYFDKPIGENPLPEGYVFKSMADGITLEERCLCAEAAFNSSHLTTDIYQLMQSAPLYRKELDLCTVDSEGKVASFCTIWYDEESNVAYYEPVGTHPEHQKKGLGKAVLIEGLKRLNDMGAEVAYVGSWGENRKAFYHSAGFKTYDAYRPWLKTI